MKIIKKINNNFVIALDSVGNQVIVRGKGLGFLKIPCELEETNKIERIYFGIAQSYIPLLSELTEEVLNAAEKIVIYAKENVNSQLNPSLLFMVADHINFCIIRFNNGNKVNFSKTVDFRFTYKKEVEVGEYALKIVNEDLGVELPSDEKYGFALNIINGEITSNNDDYKDESSKMIEDCVSIIEKELDFKVMKDSANYERFMFHMNYLFKKMGNVNLRVTEKMEGEELFKQACKQYPKVYECAQKVNNYIYSRKNWELDNDELLYLMLHINRLFARALLEI